MKKYFVLIFAVFTALALSACRNGAVKTAEATEPQPVETRGFAWEVVNGEAMLTGIGNVTEGDISSVRRALANLSDKELADLGNKISGGRR